MTRNLLTLIGKELRSLLADPILILLIAYMFTGMVIAMSQSNTDILTPPSPSSTKTARPQPPPCRRHPPALLPHPGRHRP